MTSRYGDRQAPKNFIKVAWTSVTAGATQVIPTANQEIITVFRPDVVNILCTAASEAGASSPVYFHFTHRGHENEAWPTEASVIIAITSSSVTQVVGPGESVVTMGYYDMKLLKVVNGNATQKLTSVNASLSWKA